MKLMILSMASDGEVLYRIDNKYNYRVWIDTAHYPTIKKNWVQKPGYIINLLKQIGKVERL